METVLQKTIASVREQELSGVVFTDSTGLCFAAAPAEEARYAGAYNTIIRKAALLSTDVDSPVVLIETDTKNIILRECDDAVIAAIQAHGVNS